MSTPPSARVPGSPRRCRATSKSGDLRAGDGFPESFQQTLQPGHALPQFGQPFLQSAEPILQNSQAAFQRSHTLPLTLFQFGQSSLLTLFQFGFQFSQFSPLTIFQTIDAYLQQTG